MIRCKSSKLLINLHWEKNLYFTFSYILRYCYSVIISANNFRIIWGYSLKLCKAAIRMRDSKPVQAYYVTQGQHTFVRVSCGSGTTEFVRMPRDSGTAHICKDTMWLTDSTILQGYHVTQGQHTFARISCDSGTTHVCKSSMWHRDSTDLQGYHVTQGQGTFVRMPLTQGQHTFARVSCDSGTAHLCKDIMWLRDKTRL